MESLPARASDAGPEDGKPRDWYEHCEEARELIHSALQHRNDHIKVERHERLRILSQSVTELAEAMMDIRGEGL